MPQTSSLLLCYFSRSGLLCAGVRKAFFGSPDSEGIVPVTCEALAVFALNPVSHRSLKAAATFQSTLNLLNCLRSVEKSRFETFETKELVSHSWSLQSLAAHICACFLRDAISLV